MKRFLLLVLTLFTGMGLQAQGDITFRVDMTQYNGPAFGGVFMNSAAGGWCGDCAPLTDADSDGIWEGTYNMPAGAQEYKFSIDGWTAQEALTEGDPCTITSGNFTNRIMDVTGNAVLDPVCWNSCDVCGAPPEMASVTMNVNMSEYTVSADGLFLAGGSAFGGPGDNPMTDPDGDGIYSITLMRPIGTTSNYTFVNGSGWGDKENIAGLPCADPNNFNDRLAFTLNQDTVINTCFAECTDDTNCTPVNMVAITMNVNMSQYTVSADGVSLAGGSAFGQPGDNPMTDPDGDGIYSVTLMRAAGTTSTYTFVNGDWWDDKEDISGQPCADPDNFNDRIAITFNEDTVINTCFQECTDDTNCTPVGADPMVTFRVDMNEYTGTFTTPELNGTFNGWCGNCNPMTDDDMDGVWEVTLPIANGSYEYKFSFDNWAGQEDLTLASPNCTVSDGTFTNRTLEVAGDAVLDAVCWESCNACGVTSDMVSVTMNVNMSEYTVAAEGVSLAGGSAFGFPGDNPMLDPDGDGIYSITLMVEAGVTSNYTFINGDGWGDKENIEGLPCADPDNFNDRVAVTFNEDTVINTCFAECTDDTNCTPVNMVSITMNVNMSEYTVAPEGVSLAGGSSFGFPGDNLMEDPDGDGVYSITLMRPIGTTSHYTFVNGPDWANKENIAGQPCADPNNFNDRMAITFNENTEINTCFGECTDDLNCSPVAEPTSVTFQVNMQDETTNANGVFLGANFDGWSGNLEMEDPDGDDIWTLTIGVPQGVAEYKFINGDWEALDPVEDADCTLTTGAFTNRVLDVGSDDIVVDIVCFNSCLNCTDIGTYDILAENTMFRLAPSLTNGTPVMLYFNEAAKEERTVTITNTIGQVVYRSTTAGAAVEHAIETADLANGLYYVIVESDQQAALEKFIVSK